MAVTKITTTGNLKVAVQYITSNKPHHTSKLINKRVLASTSINATDTPNAFIKQGLDTLPKQRKNKAIRKIISFSPKKLPVWKPGSISTAIAITKRADQRQFPNSQVLIAVQADNKNHVLHTHSIIINSDLKTGKAVTPRATWRKSIKYTDEACRHFGFTPSTTPTRNRTITNSAAIHRRQAGNYSYLFDLRNRVNSALLRSSTLNGYCSHLVKHGVYMRLFRRKNGKLHVYQTPGSFGVPYKSGYLRLKKHFTYDLWDHTGHFRVIRPKKLGADTDRSYIIHTLKYNQTHKHHRGLSIAKGSKTKNRSNGNFGANKKKITLDDLRPTIRRSYHFVDCGPQFSKDQRPELKTSHEPLQHPLLHFHASNQANMALSRLFRAFRLPARSKQEKIARNAEINKAKAKFSEKAYQSAVSNYHDKQFLFLEKQANRAALAKYNFETKRALWIQAHQGRQIGPTW